MKGAVHRLRDSRGAVGHEQRGTRYGVVVQSSLLQHWGTWIVVPTSTSAVGGRLRPEIDFGRGPTIALVDALRAVDPEHRLGEQVGFITYGQLKSIHRAMETLFDVKLSDRPLPRGPRPQRPRRTET